MNKNKGFMWIGILIATVVVLVVGSVAYYAGKNSSKQDNNNQQQNQNDIIQNNKNTVLLYNGKEYNLENSMCNISSEYNVTYTLGSPIFNKKNWAMSIGFVEKNTPAPFNAIYFNKIINNENTIDGFMNKGINIASQGIKISNQLTSNTYSTASLNDISVVWEELNRTGNNFSGNGYIEIKKEIKPNEYICSGKENVNQKPMNSSNPDYSMFCPSPIFPAQKIYFNCNNGIIDLRPAVRSM